MKKTIVDDLLLVGNLQMLALPLVSLFVNKEGNALYLFFRISGAKKQECQYIVTKVSSEAVNQYMDGVVPLQTLYDGKECQKMEIRDKMIYNTNSPLKSLPKDRLKNAGLFIPEFCDEQIEIEYFLDSFISKTA